MELFNREAYFESHEVMESLWLSVPKEDRYRDLYKGVIQAAASILLKRKQIDGAAVRLARSSLGYLTGYLGDAFEIDAVRLTDDLKAWIGQGLRVDTQIRICCSV
ncbi:MAG: DUF309 domain-containing protein [Candidatus Omnitrophica bacterium]|nr:DUF309 domain-containing protein [Candidatus Omnitrophota bacterium]